MLQACILSALKFILLFGKMMMTFYDGTNGDVLTSKVEFYHIVYQIMIKFGLHDEKGM